MLQHHCYLRSVCFVRLLNPSVAMELENSFFAYTTYYKCKCNASIYTHSNTHTHKCVSNIINTKSKKIKQNKTKQSPHYTISRQRLHSRTTRRVSMVSVASLLIIDFPSKTTFDRTQEREATVPEDNRRATAHRTDE